MSPPSPPARRWPVVTALGLDQILAWGSSYYLLAVLAPPIAADTGWPLTWILGALSLGLLVAGEEALARRHGEIFDPRLVHARALNINTNAAHVLRSSAMLGI